MRSLKTKLIVLIIGLVVTAHFTTGFFIVNQVEEAMHKENHRRGMAVALDLAHSSAVAIISQDLAELQSYVGFSMQQEYVTQAMVIDTNCRIVMHNDLRKVGTTLVDYCQQGSGTYSDHYFLENNEKVIDIRVPIEVAGVRLGTAVIGYSHAGVKNEITALKTKILLILLLGTSVAIICAVLVGEYITRPLKHLSHVARNLGSGCFNIEKIKTKYTDEIGELNHAFYEMAGKLEKEVCYDTLTGLYTRNIFEIRLAQECAQCLRHDQHLAVMMVDVDHFKAVNDTYGHLAGDKVLQDIAQIMVRQVRGEDCLARYGGEEFVGLLPQTSEQGALNAAEKVRKKVEEYSFHLNGYGTISLTVSIGVALFPEDTKDFRRLLELADQAMYTAKKGGRNLICPVPGKPCTVA